MTKYSLFSVLFTAFISVFFFSAPPALAATCSELGGTCRGSACNSATEVFNQSASASCTSVTLPVCCVPKGGASDPVGPCTATSCGPNATCSSSGVCVPTAGTACTATSCGPNATCSSSGVCVPTTSNNNNNTSTPGPTVSLVDPLGGMTLQSFLTSILDFVIQIGTVVIIFMIVYIGYLFVVARGNETKLTEARRALLWTVVGALILLGSKAIAIGLEETVKAIQQGR